MASCRAIIAVLLVAFGSIATGAEPSEQSPPTRSNSPLAIEDDGGSAQSPPLPASVVAVPPVPADPQAAYTDVPRPQDGLRGNRQIALTPFPNLHMQSGPLQVNQLPWYDTPGTAITPRYDRSLQYESAIGTLKSSGLGDGEFGWYNSLLYGRPFWEEQQIGLQAGLALEPTSFPQILAIVSAGFFRQAIWQDGLETGAIGDRLSAGVVYDGMYDSENRVLLGQFRGQIGYAMEPHREAGIWFSVPLNNDVSRVGWRRPVKMSAAAQLNFYYRQTLSEDWDGTLFLGAAESPGGGQIGAYLSYRISTQASWTFWGVANFGDDGAYAAYTGLRIDFHPLSTNRLLSGNPENRYRPFLRMADHVNMQVRRLRR